MAYWLISKAKLLVVSVSNKFKLAFYRKKKRDSHRKKRGVENREKFPSCICLCQLGKARQFLFTRYNKINSPKISIHFFIQDKL